MMRWCLRVAALVCLASTSQAYEADDFSLFKRKLEALEATVTDMRGEHAARLAAMEKAMRDCKCAPLETPPEQQEGGAISTEPRSLTAVNSATTRLTKTSVHTETVNSTDVHIWGTLFWHGRAWTPDEPTPVPTPSPSLAPTLFPTVQPTPFEWQIISTYQNGWVSYGSSYGPSMYRKDPFGFVHFNGLIKEGAVGVPAFTLLPGFRPDYSQLLVDEANHLIGLVEIKVSTGNVVVLTGSNVWTSICGMQWPTAQVTGWIAVSSFFNGWQNYGGEYSPFRYFKDSRGIVHLDGLLKGGVSGSGTFAYQLPDGYRPSHYTIFLSNAYYTAGLVQIRPDGNVEMHTTHATWTAFSGFSYFAAGFAGWVYPALGSGWLQYADGYPDARYTKDAYGYVHLDGLIKSGGVGSANAIFTFPVGFRPTYDQLFSVRNAGTTGLFIIQANGVVYLYSGDNTWCSLAGLTFFVD